MGPAIIVGINGSLELPLQVLEICDFPMLQVHILDCPIDPLYMCILINLVAHADLDSGIVEHLDILLTYILPSPIRMVNERVAEIAALPVPESHPQGYRIVFRPHIVGNRISYYHARVHIHDENDVEEVLANLEIGQVACPELVGAIQHFARQQVSITAVR